MIALQNFAGSKIKDQQKMDSVKKRSHEGGIAAPRAAAAAASSRIPVRRRLMKRKIDYELAADREKGGKSITTQTFKQKERRKLKDKAFARSIATRAR